MEATEEKRIEKQGKVTGEENAKRNFQWEENHNKIVECVKNLLAGNSKPTITRISEKTGISRPTIYAHIEEFEQEQANSTNNKLIMLMQHTILENICKKALDGDLKAAKIFLDRMSPGKAQRNINNNFINNRSNTIQINGYVISEEMLQNLPPEKRMMIEDIFKPITGKK
jgi:hypothetical protein